MPPVAPNPVGDLARMYRQRIPTAPKSIGRLGPVSVGGGGGGWLNAVGRFARNAVESLDPRFILSEGGRSVQHVVGDATELARSVFTGEDTLSQSPTARAYQAAGGGAPGVFAAAMPYANVATALVPEARLLTPAGRVAAGADVAERVGQSLMNQEVKRIGETQARLAGLPSAMTGDDLYKAIAAARSPQEVREIRNRFERQLVDNYVAKRTAASQSLPDIPEWYDPVAAQRWSAWGDSVPTQFGEANKVAITAMPENPFAPTPTISVSGPNLRNVLESGQYGTMFDDGAGLNRRGTDYELWRRHNEYLLYGDQSGQQPPVYGFLRNPADPYAASSYGTDISRSNLFEASSAMDNFFITIRPNRRMTSAAADSFRVNSPEEVLPLVSTDKPHASGYREIQMWGGPINRRDIVGAELVIPDPTVLFSTISQDSDTNTVASLQQLIARIDAYLGPNGTITQLEKDGTPVSVTIRRDYGRAPLPVTGDVRTALNSIKAQAQDYLNQIGQGGRRDSVEFFRQELLPQIESEIASDPRTLYAQQLAMRNNPEAAANAIRMANAGNNANPYWIPSDYGYQFMPMLETLPDRQFRDLINAYFSESAANVPRIADVASAVIKNDVDGLASLMPKLFDPDSLDEFVASASAPSMMKYNPYESSLHYLMGSRPKEMFEQAAQKVYDALPPLRQAKIEQIIKEANTYEGLG